MLAQTSIDKYNFSDPECSKVASDCKTDDRALKKNPSPANNHKNVGISLPCFSPSSALRYISLIYPNKAAQGKELQMLKDKHKSALWDTR